MIGQLHFVAVSTSRNIILRRQMLILSRPFPNLLCSRYIELLPHYIQPGCRGSICLSFKYSTIMITIQSLPFPIFSRVHAGLTDFHFETFAIGLLSGWSLVFVIKNLFSASGRLIFFLTNLCWRNNSNRSAKINYMTLLNSFSSNQGPFQFFFISITLK